MDEEKRKNGRVFKQRNTWKDGRMDTDTQRQTPESTKGKKREQTNERTREDEDIEKH